MAGCRVELRSADSALSTGHAAFYKVTQTHSLKRLFPNHTTNPPVCALPHFKARCDEIRLIALTTAIKLEEGSDSYLTSEIKLTSRYYSPSVTPSHELGLTERGSSL